MPPLPGARDVLCCTRYPVKTCTTPSAMRTGKCTVSSRCVVPRIRRMFGSRWSLSAAMLNCSSAISHGSRWVWSMTAALAFTSTSDASWSRRLQLFDHEPIIGRLARRVRAVPILEHNPAKALRLQRVTPSSQPPRDIGREPDVGAWREDPFEVPPPLQASDLEGGLAADPPELQPGEDLATPDFPRLPVPRVVDLR